MIQSKENIVLGVFIALGLALCGYFIGNMHLNTRLADNIVEVKGLAERTVEANLAVWDITVYTEYTGKVVNIKDLYSKTSSNREKVLNFLASQGFKGEEVSVSPLNYREEEYRSYDTQVLQDVKHTVSSTVSVKTNKVKEVTQVREKLSELISDGVSLSNNAPEFLFTKLNEIKPDMLKESTQNAKIAAEEFAKNAGAKVGKIKSAKQGGFTIRDEMEEYGDRRKIKKDVRVVASVMFYLE